MSRTKGNGLDAAHDQPAKTLTKRIVDFIARCDSLANKNPWIFLLILVSAIQAVSLVLTLVLGALR
jgi:hypothetical protein